MSSGGLNTNSWRKDYSGLNGGAVDYSPSMCLGRGSRKDTKYRKYQCKLYNFLERPRGTKAVIYHIFMYVSQLSFTIFILCGGSLMFTDLKNNNNIRIKMKIFFAWMMTMMMIML